MARASAAARDLRQAAARLNAIGDEAVAEAGRRAVELAVEIGSRSRVGRAQLRARVVASKRAAGRSSVTVWPVPAWSWSVRSYGRAPVRPTRKQALRFAGRSGVVHATEAQGVASGDGAVDEWQQECESEFVRVARELVEEV